MFTKLEIGRFWQAIESIAGVPESGSFMKPTFGTLYPTTACRKSGPLHSSSPHLYVYMT